MFYGKKAPERVSESDTCSGVLFALYFIDKTVRLFFHGGTFSKGRV